jgi:hypothetical protein
LPYLVLAIVPILVASQDADTTRNQCVSSLSRFYTKHGGLQIATDRNPISRVSLRATSLTLLIAGIMLFR